MSAIGNALYISANQNQHDATLSTLTQSHSTGKAFARALVDTFGEQDTGATNRFSRHTGKLYAEWPVETPSL
ncbi:hypothetical protein AB0D35_15585 [Streptomyces sp. NPDC048301]|uniref:hypothetical protein n=1 Tax=Streptomyces sp. NPDC048301 TaxID=3155631 RepID=UPI0034240278